MSNICVFGDSIAWGSWDPIGGGWVGRLREKAFEHVDEDGEFAAVYNCGIPGDTVGGVLQRIDIEAQAREPDVIVIAIGINDIPRSNYQGTPVEEFTRRYNELIAKAEQFTSKIVLVTPTNVDESRVEHDYRNARIEKLVHAVEACATQHDLPLVNAFGTMTNEDLFPDGLHPGPDGHEKLFRMVAPAVFGN